MGGKLLASRNVFSVPIQKKKKKLGWTQLPSAYFAEETNVLLLLGIELQYLGQLT